MNSKMFALAVVALLGCFAWPVVASPVEVAVDDRVVETTELDESESGWEWGTSVGVTYHSKYVIYGLTYNQHGVLVPNVELLLEGEVLIRTTREVAVSVLSYPTVTQVSSVSPAVYSPPLCSQSLPANPQSSLICSVLIAVPLHNAT